MTIKLYYHKTDGGAEYLTDKCVKWQIDGIKHSEGTFTNAKYIIRLDSDIENEAELTIVDDK